MPEFEIKDKNNKAVGKINLPDEVFGVKVKDGVLTAQSSTSLRTRGRAPMPRRPRDW